MKISIALIATLILVFPSGLLASNIVVSNFYTSHLTEATETNSTTDILQHSCSIGCDFLGVDCDSNSDNIQIERTRDPLENLIKTASSDLSDSNQPDTEEKEKSLQETIEEKKRDEYRKFYEDGPERIVYENYEKTNAQMNMQNVNVFSYTHFMPILEKIGLLQKSLSENANDSKKTEAHSESLNFYSYLQSDTKKKKVEYFLDFNFSSKINAIDRLLTCITETLQVFQKLRNTAAKPRSFEENIKIEPGINNTAKINVTMDVIHPKAFDNKTKIVNINKILGVVSVMFSLYFLVLLTRRAKNSASRKTANLNRHSRSLQYNRKDKKRYGTLNKYAAIVLFISLTTHMYL